MKIWGIIIFAGLITYAIRLSFILILERIRIPEWFSRGLRYVPPAVLSALLVPALADLNGQVDLTWHNPQILAGILAILVAWRTRNVVYTLIAGLVSYLVLIYIL
jgi:branched-subunit amino acid transport protein